MKKMVYLLSVLALQFILWGCSVTSAPDDFLELKVGVIYSNGVLSSLVREPSAPTLKELITSLNPGKWEKVDNNQWIYRIKNTDAVARKEYEISISFVKHPREQNVVIFDRVVINGNELSSVEKDYLFNEKVFPLAEAKAKQKTQTSTNPPAQPQMRQSTEPEKKEGATVEQSGICKGLDLSITVEQLECLDRKYSSADKDLNILYKQKMADLDETKKASLKKEQIAWVKEKESKCAQAGKEMQGGTLETVMIKDCMVQMTEQRVAYLKGIK